MDSPVSPVDKMLIFINQIKGLCKKDTSARTPVKGQPMNYEVLKYAVSIEVKHNGMELLLNATGV